MNTTHEVIMYIYKTLVLFNAISSGWNVKKIDANSYVLKKRNISNFCLESFIDDITKNNRIDLDRSVLSLSQ